MSDNDRWFHPAGSSSDEHWTVSIRPQARHWRHTGLLVAELSDGDVRQLELEDFEAIVVPLSGGVAVEVTDSIGEVHAADLAGRESVFHGSTDVAYVPRGAVLRLTAAGPAKVAVALAVAAKRDAPLPFRHLARSQVPVELRGAGVASREVRNFGVPAVLDADSIIACEVLTPAGNWSSYPPHKHDVERPGEETELEEIYYFLTRPEGEAGAAPAAAAFGYQRVYGTDERPIDVLAEVRDDDVVLVPHGWHGPAMAPPGYDMYYLNVMAGPGPARAWLICDDPAHAWVRTSWDAQEVDARLPFGSG